MELKFLISNFLNVKIWSGNNVSSFTSWNFLINFRNFLKINISKIYFALKIYTTIAIIFLKNLSDKQKNGACLASRIYIQVKKRIWDIVYPWRYLINDRDTLSRLYRQRGSYRRDLTQKLALLAWIQLRV